MGGYLEHKLTWQISTIIFFHWGIKCCGPTTNLSSRVIHRRGTLNLRIDRQVVHAAGRHSARQEQAERGEVRAKRLDHDRTVETLDR